MKLRRWTFPLRSVFALALGGTLAACSGDGSNGSPPPDGANPPPTALSGGRLVYSLGDVTDTLKMYDQTVPTNRFTGSTVPATADAKLVLSNDGLTMALLESDGRLSVVSSGLEHLEGSNPHTHELGIVSPMALTGVSKVVATTDHFSVLNSDGSSTLIEAADGAVTTLTWSDVVYPTLVLEGGQYLTFSANAEDETVTDIAVVDESGSSGAEGLIFVRPNVDGFFTHSISCTDGVDETVQTERFTVIRCGDGTLRWLASGFVAPEGHPFAGQTLHVTQRYPATDTRRAGEIGELPAGGSAFIENITGLTATRSADNVIVAWAGEQLWLVNLHSDHSHRLSAYESLPMMTDIIAVAASTKDDALTVLADNGTASIFRFVVNASANPEINGPVVAEQLGSANAVWTAERSHLVTGPFDFFVINRDTATLYHIDAHEPGDDYHLHAQFNDASLGDAHSAVFAHVAGGDHNHDHDHDHEDDHDHDHEQP